MTYFETITEMKNEIGALTQITKESYLDVEAKLVKAVGDYVLDAMVSCSIYGKGKVVAYNNCILDKDTLENLILDIAFVDDDIKRFSFMTIMNNGFVKFEDLIEIQDIWNSAYEVHNTLTTLYKESERTAWINSVEKAKKAEADKKAEVRYQKLKEKAIRDFDQLVQQASDLSEVDEFYYALGWLTSHIGSVTAALPDYLESSFTKHFGSNTNARVVDSKKKTCNGNSMQWTFGFKATLRKSENIPSILNQYLSSTGKAIANTSFIWDLIDTYGFKFGRKQDVDEIKQTVPDKFISSFEAGLTA
jgi:hypothetical protein